VTAEENTINAEMTVHSLCNTVDAMHALFDDHNTRGAIVNDFEFIDKAQDKLAALVEKIRRAQERQIAKLHQYEFMIAAE
jgi:hypothetical protein